MVLRKEQCASKGRHLCCIVAIGSKWKLVGRFYGKYLSAKLHRSIIWWEDAPWKTFWATIQGTYCSISFIGWVSHHNCEGSVTSPFGKNVLPGFFLGYALYAGGIWKGDVLIADLEELETMDASEIYSERLNSKEVIFPKQGEFIFPIEDGRIRTFGRDQKLRTSTLIRHRPIQGGSNIDFLGESERSLPPPLDSLPDAGKAMNDCWSMSWSFIYRHHVEPWVKLYTPREESFPIPLKYIDVTKTTHTNLDVKQEKRIDYWNMDGSRDLSDPSTGFTQFTLLDEKPPDGYTWSGRRWPGGWVSPRQVSNRRRRTRKGPEPACVQTHNPDRVAHAARRWGFLFCEPS